MFVVVVVLSFWFGVIIIVALTSLSILCVNLPFCRFCYCGATIRKIIRLQAMHTDIQRALNYMENIG